MINHNLLLASVAMMAAAFAANSPALAGARAPLVSNSETSFSVGIQYDFADAQLALVAAARRTKTDTDNDVTGRNIRRPI